jgi:antitoxin component YwqK of YwqJK toxin-antitoxin module
MPIHYFADGSSCECDEIRRDYLNPLEHVRQETPYINGRKNGTRKEYYTTGHLRQETPYENNKRHGVQKAFYVSGVIEYETHFEHGRHQGTDKAYYDSGILASEVFYERGYRHGLHRSYGSAGGILTREEVYIHGQIMVKPVSQRNGLTIWCRTPIENFV